MTNLLSFAVVTFLFFGLIFPSHAETSPLSQGPNHNGVRLHWNAQDVQGQVTRLSFQLECRKNWTGVSFGFAYIEVWKPSDTGSVYEIDQYEMSCDVSGPGDGGTRSMSSNLLVPMPVPINVARSDYIILGTVRHGTADIWQLLGQQIRNEMAHALGQRRELVGNRTEIEDSAALVDLKLIAF